MYTVETVSLGDLLREHSAPETIDYLSIDTEGSELEILEAFDFQDYRFLAITVEHNHVQENRERIKNLLESKGYVNVLGNFSRWDDWYLHPSVELDYRGLFQD